MYIQTEIDGFTAEVSTPISVGQWTMIYASYIYSVGGVGASEVYINGVEGDAHPIIQNAKGPSHFSNADILTVGPGWTGQLRRFQIYSPTTLRLFQGLILCCLSPILNITQEIVLLLHVTLIQVPDFIQHA